MIQKLRVRSDMAERERAVLEYVDSLLASDRIPREVIEDNIIPHACLKCNPLWKEDPLRGDYVRVGSEEGKVWWEKVDAEERAICIGLAGKYAHVMVSNWARERHQTPNGDVYVVPTSFDTRPLWTHWLDVVRAAKNMVGVAVAGESAEVGNFTDAKLHTHPNELGLLTQLAP